MREIRRGARSWQDARQGAAGKRREVWVVKPWHDVWTERRSRFSHTQVNARYPSRLLMAWNTTKSRPCCLDPHKGRQTNRRVKDKGKHMANRQSKSTKGKPQQSKGRKKPTGKRQPRERVWVDLKTKKLYNTLDEGKPGTRVAIYDLVDTGTINLAYASAKKRSRKARSRK